jgi:hypothetical protein
MTDDNCIHGEIDANNITTHADMKLSIGASTPPPPTILIQNPDTGRHLLSIHPDGTVTGEIEDTSEAARVFVEHIRRMIAQPTQSEAQAAEIERLRTEAKAQFDRGYYDGSTHPIVRHDALREALEAAPLIGATESAESFKARQDAWLNGQYRAALDQSK